MQIGADTRKIDDRFHTDCTETLRVANARALQDQGGSVDARCQHERASLERDGLAVANGMHRNPRRRLVKAIDKRAVKDRQIRQVPHRIEVGEGGIPTCTTDDVDRLETKAVVAVKVAQVGCHLPAERTRRVETVTMERHRLRVRVGAYAHRFDHVGKDRRNIVCSPTGQAPGVVVGAVADGRDGTVMSRTATDHTSAFEGPASIAAGIAPVMRKRERRGVHQVGGPTRRAVGAVIWAGLDEQNLSASLS